MPDLCDRHAIELAKPRARKPVLWLHSIALPVRIVKPGAANLLEGLSHGVAGVSTLVDQQTNTRPYPETIRSSTSSADPRSSQCRARPMVTMSNNSPAEKSSMRPRRKVRGAPACSAASFAASIMAGFGSRPVLLAMNGAKPIASGAGPQPMSNRASSPRRASRSATVWKNSGQ